MAERRIVAVGGGDVFALWDRVLDLVPPSPRVLWVGTASAESPEYTLMVHDALRDRADVRRVDFFPWPPENLRELVLSQDVIVVGGGNTANMLAIWRAHGFDGLLREAWEQGTVLTGVSAGMICWFEAGVTDSFGPQLAGMPDGLAASESGMRRVFTTLQRAGLVPNDAAFDMGRFVDPAFLAAAR